MDNSGVLIRIASALERAVTKEEEPLGKCHIEITINKDEILRGLDEIQKKAEEVAKLLEKLSVPTCPCPMPPYTPWPGYPYYTWENPGTTCGSVSIGGGSATGETMTYATAPSTPTGE